MLFSQDGFWGSKLYSEYEMLVDILGPDRLELIIFDIIGKKFYNHPSRLQL